MFGGKMVSPAMNSCFENVIQAYLWVFPVYSKAFDHWYLLVIDLFRKKIHCIESLVDLVNNGGKKMTANQKFRLNEIQKIIKILHVVTNLETRSLFVQHEWKTEEKEPAMYQSFNNIFQGTEVEKSSRLDDRNPEEENPSFVSQIPELFDMENEHFMDIDKLPMPSGFDISFVRNTPLQTNQIDCGVFVMANLLSIATRSPMDYDGHPQAVLKMRKLFFDLFMEVATGRRKVL
mmetsp:Transcript_25820/g.65241  ORF Transcript_25820/g.65241 Transcript_25820/m.65241 type:complete len:233 (-) Transcript_25820:2018-2716(-)